MVTVRTFWSKSARTVTIGSKKVKEKTPVYLILNGRFRRGLDSNGLLVSFKRQKMVAESLLCRINEYFSNGKLSLLNNMDKSLGPPALKPVEQSLGSL